MGGRPRDGRHPGRRAGTGRQRKLDSSASRRRVAASPEDPDALNLLAYTLRHTGDIRNAEGFYLKALAIEPEHIGANEYLGELYVGSGELDKALERLVVLEAACSADCEEYLELKALIEATD